MNVCQFKCSLLYNSITSFILFVTFFVSSYLLWSATLFHVLVRKHILQVNSKCQYFIHTIHLLLCITFNTFFFCHKIMYFSYTTIVEYFLIRICNISSYILLLQVVEVSTYWNVNKIFLYRFYVIKLLML